MRRRDEPKTLLQQALEECARLNRENARLQQRIDELENALGRRENSGPKALINESTLSNGNVIALSPQKKISLFRSLFRGRDDVYAVRWEGKYGRTGYSPACINKWNGPSVTASSKSDRYKDRELLPLTDTVIRDHLTGNHTVGIYALLQDETCWFLAVDFDKKSWRDDAISFIETCDQVGIPTSLERSRSGN